MQVTESFTDKNGQSMLRLAALRSAACSGGLEPAALQKLLQCFVQ